MRSVAFSFPVDYCIYVIKQIRNKKDRCAYNCLSEKILRLELIKVTVDFRGVFWGKQYSALCINGKYINLYIIGELISLATRLC